MNKFTPSQEKSQNSTGDELNQTPVSSGDQKICSETTQTQDLTIVEDTDNEQTPNGATGPKKTKIGDNEIGSKDLKKFKKLF